MEKFVSEVNWKLLRKQKNDLVEVAHDPDNKISKHERDSLHGIIGFIDGIQDLVEEHYLSEEEVFGEMCEECESFKRPFMHNCSGSSNMVEMEGCPHCDDHCAECDDGKE